MNALINMSRTMTDTCFAGIEGSRNLNAG